MKIIKQLGIPLTVAMLVLFPVSLQAQQPQVEETEKTEKVKKTEKDVVTVTGSRIKRTGFDTLQPGRVIDYVTIKEDTAKNLASFLREGSDFGGTSEWGSQGSYTVAQNFLDYLGMGTQRTLVLVNGRRFVSSNPITLFSDASAGLQVDLNAIPLNMISRVEVIATGGAPIYGADAVAGTVNIISRKSFEGAEFDYTVEMTGRQTGKRHNFEVLLGKNFHQDRGNVTFAAQVENSEGILSKDWDWAHNRWVMTKTKKPGVQKLVLNPRYNGFTWGGLLSPTPVMMPNRDRGFFKTSTGEKVYWQFDPQGHIVPFNPGKKLPDNFRGIDSPDLPYMSEVSVIRSPQERALAALSITYDINKNLRYFLEGNYAKTKGTEERNQPIWNDWTFGKGHSYALKFSIDNPFLKPSARAKLLDAGVKDSFWLQRGSNDVVAFAPNTTELEVYRIATGLEGDFTFFQRDFAWNVMGLHGKSSMESFRNHLHQARWKHALNAVRAPDGRIVCDVTLKNPGSKNPDIRDCQPMNLFGDGAPSDAARKYVLTRFGATAMNEQQVFSANISGDVFFLPAGAFKVGLGVEHHREKASFTPNENSRKGVGRSVPTNPSSGKYDTNEIYGEFLLPLLSRDVLGGFVDRFSIEGAYRYVKHSTAGGDSTYTLGARFAPVRDLEFRGNYTQSIRAPAIVELFLPKASLYSFIGSDPCDSSNLDKGFRKANRKKNCLAANIPASFQADQVSKQGVKSGNAKLENEKADVWSVGVVLKPRWVEGLSISADYMNFDIENMIQSFSLRNAMESCYDADDFPNTYCKMFQRDGRQQISAFDVGYVNAGYFKKDLIWFKLIYNVDLADLLRKKSDWGQINVVANVINLLNQTYSSTGLDVNDTAGQSSNPALKGTVRVKYTKGPMMAYLKAKYNGKGVINKTAKHGAYLDENNNPFHERKAYWRFTAGVSYTIKERVRLNFDVINLLDQPYNTPRDRYFGRSPSLGRRYVAGVKVVF